jgi:hypothetical protein
MFFALHRAWLILFGGGDNRRAVAGRAERHAVWI